MTAMSEYSKVHKATCAAVEAALKANGLTLKKITASVDQATGEIRFSIKTHLAAMKGSDGKATDPDRERFKREAEIGFANGPRLDWLDRPFRSGGQSYSVCGLKPRGRLRLIAKRADGKMFKFAVEDVARLMAA